MKNLFFLLVFLSSAAKLFGQQDTINLETINLADRYLNYSETGHKTILSDSIIHRNGKSLTDLLNFNSLIYFKENGAGMVSSPAFRGTTASQTAVIWNGININSKMLGQTDFNTVNSMAYDNLMVRPGGGSIGYGSGAIGGSVHLNNEIRFSQGLKNRFFASYGEFKTYSADLKSSWSDDNFSFSVNLGRTGSDNNYKSPKSKQENLNGHFWNNNLSMTAAYKINSKNKLKFYGNIFDGDRHFPLVSPSAMRTKYHDYNTRSMIEWDGGFNRISSNLKLVRLGEEYKYYPNASSNNYEYGDSESWIAKYDVGYGIRNLSLNLIADYEYSRLKGSVIEFAKRNTASAGILLKHRIFEKLLYEASVRKEFSDSYTAPFLYSFGLSWQVKPYYRLSFNTSKNFRMPTFNDLFWPGSGNLDLKAESSQQYEINNQLNFGNFSFNLNAYHNDIKDLIQWIPVGSNSVPENVTAVKINGIEALVNYYYIRNNHKLEINMAYGYTSSENQKLKKQLIYVPSHRANAAAAYSIKKFTSYYQFSYNGKIFTDSQNTKPLKDYGLSNIGAEWNFGADRNLNLGVQVRNLFNKEYQNLINRPMPGRNYNVYVNFKF